MKLTILLCINIHSDSGMLVNECNILVLYCVQVGDNVDLTGWLTLHILLDRASEGRGEVEDT